ncbi:ubiquitin carboxyl-terminal hydrolase MINDY-3 homolog [Bacillus rossius redtenbacheri]|uniref:ubiquitin carboxyl-terminal hydrolase MINDY-3 homolog n=1 Tax=Bacillus rossius redtenbacheri TaxID=93214 RepID=UPI002FDDC7A8
MDVKNELQPLVGERVALYENAHSKEMACHTSPVSELRDVRNLLWGSCIKEDVFRRWAQGFQFSKYEPTALVQNEGGPCAVIAPVQAFILKSILSKQLGNNWRDADTESCNRHLVQAVCDILGQVNAYTKGKIFIATMNENPSNKPSECSDGSQSPVVVDSIENPIKPEALDCENFHARLKLISFASMGDVRTFYTQRISILRDKYGVLHLLYSVLCTKGLQQIRSEMNEPEESLIDETYGHASQSLINLMLTGRAVSYVWNHDRDIDGLRLRGVDQQAEVGFLTLLEHFRYCEVGSFLKNPKNPVWLLASETHLTVLFSPDKRLASAETPTQVACRVFKSFDPEGNNFIAAPLLQDVLRTLDLVSDKEYVDIMVKKLDPESLGIILLSAFLDEFFPEEKLSTPDTFALLHYNGLPQSCPGGQVVYREGSAVLLETDVLSVLSSDAMLTCLQTKWPSIEVQWLSGGPPSLN